MASQSAVLQRRAPARDISYIIKQWCLPSLPETVTVLHQVPAGVEELASFDNPIGAIDFAKRLSVNNGPLAHWLNLSTRHTVWWAPAKDCKFFTALRQALQELQMVDHA